MAKAKDIVTAYQKALGRGDMAGARTYLHDDLSFVGPFESFQRPEPYLEALGKLHHIVERVEPRRTFVDGDDVCILYDMVTNTPGYGLHLRMVPGPRRQDRLDPGRLRRSPVRANVQPLISHSGTARRGRARWPTTPDISRRASSSSSGNSRRTTARNGSRRTNPDTRRSSRNRRCASSVMQRHD